MSRAGIRVLLVEDDMDVAAGLGDYLQVRGLAIDFAFTAAQARTRLQADAFDLVVLDVNLPGEDGLSLCRDLKRHRRLPQPVLFLTARGGLDDKLEGFAAGAVDWMIKPVAPAELLARIQAIASHVAAAAVAAPLVVGGYRLDPGGGLLTYAGRRLQLHASALAILAELLQAHPACVPRQRLIDVLWGDAPPGSDPLRAHVWQLRQALRTAFGTRPIVTERGIGYRFEAEA
ncbi:response regulator transcription factor [Luteimonas sp. RD2P54]|uniref:Response regulator transcription factor n=1 Tax=Luteimonas endophytica TaxID=3042023 RepID=A0ABT6JA65_9GAMM|nr:response regulator transcription factor [Luteimonas endophytica]MDH5823639.1 response regulator transcription factor [Luteimonas endophytica]